MSGVITNSYRPPSTTQIIIGLRPNTAARPSRTPRSGVTSPMRAVSGVFDELWNCPKPKAAGINQLVSEVIVPYRSQFIPFLIYSLQIDLYPSNDLTSRPRNSTNRSINLHTLISASILIAPPSIPLSSPPPPAIVRFRDIPLLSTCSAVLTRCFRVCFSHQFSAPCVYFCPPPHPSVLMRHPVPIPARSSSGHRHHNLCLGSPFHHFFSDPSKLALVPNQSDRSVLQNPGNPKQYAAWASTRHVSVRSFDLDSKTKEFCST